MTVGASPMVRRRRLGGEVRLLREQHKLTNEQLAARLGWSVAKLSRLENARVRPDLADVMNLLDELGVTGAKREQLILIARDAADTSGWWRKYDKDVDPRQLANAEMENSAIEIQEFQLTVVPGLLQTADYARTRFESRPAVDLPPINVDAAVEARQTRQEVLTRDAPLSYRALIDETVIVRRCGPPGVLQDQLAHLLKLTELPNVEVRLFPYDGHTEGHYLPLCSFSLYRFADPSDPELALLETGTSDLVLGDEEDVSRYKLIFKHLWETALDPDTTRNSLTNAWQHSEEDLE
ncbi:MAG: helix-turn-helix domain-containing protein [Micromonosporaceae bacterium]|nr:helix-turn-helix domain-containing protein [Micromonosporaceae bacterium]